MAQHERQTYRSVGVSVGAFLAIVLCGLLVVKRLPGVSDGTSMVLGTIVVVLGAWRAVTLSVVVDTTGVTSNGVLRTRRFRWDSVAAVVVGDRGNPLNEEVKLVLTDGAEVALHALSPPVVPWMRRWNRYRGIDTVREWEIHYGVGIEDRRGPHGCGGNSERCGG